MLKKRSSRAEAAALFMMLGAFSGLALKSLQFALKLELGLKFLCFLRVWSGIYCNLGVCNEFLSADLSLVRKMGVRLDSCSMARMKNERDTKNSIRLSETTLSC